MREILFKGKKKDNGEWIEGYLLDGGMPGEKRIFIGKLVIGKWTIIGSGSVVCKDIPDGVTACGSPCRIIKNNPQP